MRFFLACTLVLTPVVLLAGCHVSHRDHGKGNNLEIGTPFGSMQVKTNEGAAAANIGLSVYPGAVPAKQSDGDDHDTADVNMNFGNFHLGVKTVSYTSTEAPDKVLAFYRTDLGRYGAVLRCHGADTLGQPTRTAEGLTCADDHKGVHFGSSDKESDRTELRAGSKQHQHIVATEPEGGGTAFKLIALDLPEGNFSFNPGEKSN